MSKTIIVGGTLREAAARVANAWHQAERGATAELVDTVTFVSWSGLASVMTDKRHELLRHLHQHPAVSIRALARDVGRDFKRVHEDVTALSAVGLINREDGILHVDWDEIKTLITLTARAREQDTEPSLP